MATLLPAVNKAKEQEKIDVLFANYADKLEEGSIGYISHSQPPLDECQIVFKPFTFITTSTCRL